MHAGERVPERSRTYAAAAVRFVALDRCTFDPASFAAAECFVEYTTNPI
jgi:hypothetical protein